MTPDFEALREKMLARQLITRDIRADTVLRAMGSVPRHLFVPEHTRNRAYDDCPLSIGFGQTISQPYIVAYMTEQLRPVPGMKILEIGTGSGYQAAVLAWLGCAVYTIERLGELAARAKKTFAALGFDKVRVKHRSGYEGWPEEAPFDAIIVTAAPDRVPEKLTDQLKDGGEMILPLGSAGSVQRLKLLRKQEGSIVEKDLLPVRFVPMVE